ncbi:MAG: YiiG family protein [Deltaproteobacteria bacterium]|nr:YiiG family protein [Deltaproteobacteria bacterium]
MRQLALSVMVVGLTFSGLACGNSLDREDRVLAKKPLQPKNPDPVRQSRAEGDKLSPYIACINRVFRRANSSRSRYLSWIKDSKVGPTCKERVIYAPYTLSGTSYCTTALKRANKLLPKMPALESAASDLAKSIRLLEPLLKEARRYYSAKTYKNDDCKKAQALHPKLMAAFSAYTTSSGLVSSFVNKANQKVLRGLLVRIEKKYGTNHPRYFHRKISLDARSMLAVLRAQTFEKSNKPGMPKVRSTVGALTALVEKMQSAPKKSGTVTGYGSFKSAAKSLLKACRVYVEKRAAGKPKYSRMEKRWLKRKSTSWMVKGSYARVGRRFDELIRKSNNVKFR